MKHGDGEAGKGSSKGESKPKKKRATIAKGSLATAKQLEAFDSLLRDAALCLSGGDISIVRGTDGKYISMDDLLKIAASDPRRAREVLALIGTWLRSGVYNLTGLWGVAVEFPEIQVQAQHILADVVEALERAGIVKLPKAAATIGKHFAARRKVIKGGNMTGYAAIPVFVQDLLMAVEKELVETLETWPADLPADSIDSKKAVRAFAKGCLGLAGCPEAEKCRFVIHMFEHLCRDVLTSGSIFEELLWPVALEIWPKWARAHKDFKGPGKMKWGAPLSDRKRAVDKKTDFGPEKLKPQIKNAFEQHIIWKRGYHGGGGPHLPPGPGK